MKRWLTSVLGAALLAAVVPAELAAAAGREVFTKVKIELRQESAPEPNLKSTGTYGNRQKYVNGYWLVVRVEFIPVLASAARNAWCDDVALTVRVVCPGPGSREFTAFTGVSKFWAVRLDGRTHSALMAIPPVLLDRYVSAASGVLQGAPVNKSQVRVEAVFRNAGGDLLGRAYFNCDAASFARAFRAAGSRVVEGAVLSRDLTPWSYQPDSYYERVRPAGIEAPSVPESSGGAPAGGGAPTRIPRKAPHK